MFNSEAKKGKNILKFLMQLQQIFINEFIFCQVYRKSYNIKIDTDYEENGLLMQHVIAMGMPEELSEKKSLHSGIPRKPEFGSLQFVFHQVS